MTFETIRQRARGAWEEFDGGQRCQVLVGAGTCGRAAGAEEILEVLDGELSGFVPEATVHEVGCLGLCYAEPLVELRAPGQPRVLFGDVAPEEVPRLLRDYFQRGKISPEAALAVMDGPATDGIPAFEELPMLRGQVRIVLRNAGRIDPHSIDHYIARGGYEGLSRALGMSPEEVIARVKDSGLRGRGGAGFPTGVKWEFCRRAAGDHKYMICNADEGDPGAFMDRSVIESDPYAVVEGMTIAACAIGAEEGYIYVRAEYPLAIRRLEEAIHRAEEYGLLGDEVMGTDVSFHLKLKEGAGAFVCGEETALLASIEGRRGMPRPRPPFPAQEGLHGEPTNINNVETLANVSAILRRGSEWFRQFGTASSPGTKTFALAGKINRTGLVEVPLGLPLHEIVFDIGGGIPDGKRVKAVQTGGPSGGCIPGHLMDTPVDYERLKELGSIMGSGGMVVMDEDTCMVDIARYFVEFTQSESCGKCVPCRLGTKQMLNILNAIASGRGKPEHIDQLLQIGKTVSVASLCGLGQTAPNPVLTTIEHFRDEYEEHIYEKKCASAVCPGLVSSPCRHTCPAGVDVPRYIRCIADGRYADALNVIREKIPFPRVCGRACFHPCELKCRRGLLDEPLAICALKRFVAERAGRERVSPPPRAEPTGNRVAVVGSGPAGLTAAYYLACAGHEVTVFERDEEPGGTLRTGIPPYRLPRAVIDADIDDIRSVGVDIRTGRAVEDADGLREDYDAVLLAYGAPRALQLGIPGEDVEQVVDCLSFLREANTRGEVSVGKRVAVIGGGSAAMDAARTALRVGAEDVRVLYRRVRQDMPAAPEEVREAAEEGIEFQFLTVPTGIEPEKGHLQVECRRMEPGPVDASGRRRPVPVEGSEFSLHVDTVIVAIGQRAEALGGMESEMDRRGRLQVERFTQQTSREGVFAAGDLVRGPSSIIEAIADGREAASDIDRYLGGTGQIVLSFAPEEDLEGIEMIEEEEERPRIVMRTRPPAERKRDFAEVQLGFTEEQALQEAARCLRCDLEDVEEE